MKRYFGYFDEKIAKRRAADANYTLKGLRKGKIEINILWLPLKEIECNQS